MVRKMCPSFGRWRLGGLSFLAVIMATVAAHADPAVTSVRVGDYPDKTRLVLDLSEPVKFTVFALPDPYRIVIDLPEVAWRLGDAPPKSRMITGYRYGLFKPGTSRIVLDVAKPVAISKSFLLPPNVQAGKSDRLVLDLRPTTREALLDALARPGAERPAAPQAPPVKPTPPRDGRRIVAIDPGHGGVDPGAIGVSGAKEKDITLAMARELRRQLIATDRYRVIMTRDRDVFVQLRDRIAIAQKAGADLFISLHVDSIASHRIRGGSVYTLSETASDAEAAALAAKENRADVIAGIDLSDQSEAVAKILIDLRQRLTKNASVVFAREALDELGKATRLLRHNHRFAGFAVLKAPEIPSVLVEMGYLSNATDERLLRQPQHRRKIAAALVRATNAFFSRAQAQIQP